MMIKSICASERGSSLVQILAVVAVMSVVNIGIMNMMQVQSQTNQEINLKTTVLSLRQNIVALIGNQNAWMKTYAANSSMACSSPFQSFCRANQTNTTPLRLMDATGNVFIDSAPSAGFTALGEPCNTYSAAGNDACPIKVKALWRAACTASTCSGSTVASGQIHAEEFVSITFTYSPNPKGPKNFAFNPINYNLVEQNRLRLQSNASPAIMCGDNGKIYVGTGKVIRGIASDVQGCIAYQAFFGDKGDIGPIGLRGDTGTQGPPGMNGANAVCP